jgi:transposase-like protein
MNHPDNATTNCLQCSGVVLTRLPESSEEITFFECPSCHRHYAQSPGHSLTYRWSHPVSLALYCILFNREPVPQRRLWLKNLCAAVPAKDR